MEQLEQFVEWGEPHLAWLRGMAEAWAAADYPHSASACDAAADMLEERLNATKAYLALDDTAVIVVGRLR